MSSRFVDAVLEVQQKTGQKNILLQKRLQTLTKVAEFRDVIIGEMRLMTGIETDATTNTNLEVWGEISALFFVFIGE